MFHTLGSQCSSQGIASLQATHICSLLTKPLSSMLSVPHSNPVPRAHKIGNRGLQGRAGSEGARGEPGHGLGVLLHVGVHRPGAPELRHGLGQQFVHEQGHEVLLGQGQQAARVVEVAGQHGALWSLPAPQRRLVLGLQLVEHEEGAPRAAQPREPREHVRGRAGGHVPVQPDPAGDDVDGPEGGRLGELRAVPGQGRRGAHHRLHPLGTQS
mmetsp:Transcript_45948/g.71918  ORF Transcript_45948/g.71918 Transcript_45948/m.71918 type:complete len:212 (-) Transcript_45948:1163-1798(-)